MNERGVVEISDGTTAYVHRDPGREPWDCSECVAEAVEPVEREATVSDPTDVRTATDDRSPGP